MKTNNNIPISKYLKINYFIAVSKPISLLTLPNSVEILEILILIST